MKSFREALSEVRSLETHPLVKKARKAHKQGVWDGNVDKNGNPIVFINGKPHTVVMENLSQDLSLASKNLERLAGKESGQDKKDYLALAAALKKRDIKGAKKVMRGISTLEIQGDLLNVVVGYNALLKAMYPKAKTGDNISKIIKEDLQEGYRELESMFGLREKEWRALVKKYRRQLEKYQRTGQIDKKIEDEIITWAMDNGEVQSKDDIDDFMDIVLNAHYEPEGEELSEMSHKFVFDKVAKLDKAEKLAQKFGLKTDSETQSNYYYLMVDDGGNTNNFVKWLKATDSLHESIEELEEAAPKLKGLDMYGAEIRGLRGKTGTMHTATAVKMGPNKLGFKVVDEFGSIETMDLKTFARKFG